MQRMSEGISDWDESKSLGDFEVWYRGSSLAEGDDGKFIFTTNWQSDGEVMEDGWLCITLKLIQDFDRPMSRGECSWAGRRFLPNGRNILTLQSGIYENSGSHHVYELRTTGKDSKEGAVQSYGHLSFETKCLTVMVFKV